MYTPYVNGLVDKSRSQVRGLIATPIRIRDGAILEFSVQDLRNPDKEDVIVDVQSKFCTCSVFFHQCRPCVEVLCVQQWCVRENVPFNLDDYYWEGYLVSEYRRTFNGDLPMVIVPTSD